uniref:Zinc finger protein 26 n=1 Tax=Cacopsylla melanoneura TaxID=428564 RepID=A0A8D8X520_9HEMI
MVSNIISLNKISNCVYFFHVSFRSDMKSVTKICKFDLSIVQNITKGPNENDDDNDECQWCGFKSDNLTSLYIHFHECKNQTKIFQCALCGKQLKKKSALKLHMITNHLDEQSTICNLCKETFDTHNQLKQHFEKCKLNWRKGNRKIKCSYCNTTSRSREKYLRHLQQCKPEGGFQCDYCKKKFPYKKILQNHIETFHLEDRPYACDMCGHTFKSKLYLGSHIKQVHLKHYKRKPKVFSCSACSKCFGSRRALLDHQYVHTGVKSYPCILCEKIFTYKGGLTRHIKNRHEVKEKKPPVHCEMCGKPYADQNSLGKHMKINHLGMKPKCTICNKTFYEKTGLEIHMNTHSGVKPWCCEICGRNFSTKNYLKVHTRIHTGELPYSCQVCQKSFKQKSSLTNHIRVNHPGV